MKRKISITMDENLLRQLDKLALKLGVNRSRYIEKMLSKEIEDVPVLILASACRLHGKDKALLEFNNKKIIDHQIALLKRQDLFDIYVVTDSYLLKDYLKKYSNVNVFFERNPKGNEHSLKLFGDRLGKRFLFMYCDILSDLKLNELLKFHQGNQSSLTLVLQSVPNPSKYGVASLEGSRIISFKEKPKKSDFYLAFTGIGVSEQGFLKELKGKGRFVDRLDKTRNSYGYVYEGFWKTFDTEKDFTS